MLEKLNPATDEEKRLLYVAMTRAKRNLTIHLSSNFLDNITTENLERVEDRNIYLPPNELVMHLTYKDVWLDNYLNRQHLVSQLVSGDVVGPQVQMLHWYRCKLPLIFEQQGVRLYNFHHKL